MKSTSKKIVLKSSVSGGAAYSRRLVPSHTRAMYVTAPTNSVALGSVQATGVTSALKRRIMREAVKQVQDIVSSPITAQQREKASELASRAQEAQSSRVTAKFKKSAA